MLRCISLTLLLWLSAPAASFAQRPHIVLIVADDLGYGDLSSYGAEDIETPHIDGLAAEGIRFDQVNTNSPVCSPTRAALLKGRYPDMVGVPGVVRTMDRDSWGYLHPDAVLLPQTLKGEGYHTALIGKWHLGVEAPNIPNDRGFDEFRGWLGDMMDDYWSHRRHGLNYMRWNADVIEPDGHATDLFSDWSVEYVRARADEEAPFFLYLAYNAPHFPVQPPEDRVERVRQREPGISEKRARLAAFIEHMDDGIGRVIQALRETGALENTLVMTFVGTYSRREPYRGGRGNGNIRGATAVHT